MVEDSELIRLSLKGDSEAYGALIQRHHGAVYRLSYRLLSSHADAEDAVSEVFYKAYRSLGDFNPENRFSSWLLKITSNHCLSMLRKRRPTPMAPEEMSRLTGEGRRDLSPPTPEESLLRDEAGRRVREAMERLGEEDRQIMILRFDQDLSYDQIAEIMGMPRPTVGTRIHRAKKALRAYLEEGGEDLAMLG